MLVFSAPKPPEDSVPGIVSVVNWMMAPDGHRYLYFWSARWQIITDDDIPVANFSSSEGWQMIAVSANRHVLAVLPGCQVKGWVRCEKPPPLDCYVLGGKSLSAEGKG